MSAHPDRTSTVRLTLEGGYRFRVGFDSGPHDLVSDEPPPLGQGEGPNPVELLGSAIGSCRAGIPVNVVIEPPRTAAPPARNPGSIEATHAALRTGTGSAE